MFLKWLLSVLLFISHFINLQLFSEHEWGAWSNWPMACSSTCKVGQRCRIRKCQDTKGKVVDSSKCGNLQDGKECTNCVAKGICPIDAQWSEWFSWTDCIIANKKNCGKGTRQRVRICNDPKPKYGGMFCLGNSTDIGQCLIPCSDVSDYRGLLTKTIHDHFKTLSYNVFINSHGDSATLDCYTPAYLVATGTDKKLFIIWYFNGVPLRSLRELLLEDIKGLQSKINKAGSKTSFTLPKGHFQFTGSKLIIDSVTEDDTGVFTCALNYDYTDFINTFFVLLVPGKTAVAYEFDYFTFNSFTDGLEKVDFFDKAEIRWFLNGEKKFSGLLASVDKRFYTIYVNKSMEGHWECHLFADFDRSRHWIVNSFDLKISYPRSLWDKFAEDPLLSKLCYYFLCGIFLMAAISITSFLIVKLRSTDWLNLKRKEAIIQEEVDNNRMMLIIARKRAMQKTMELMKMSGDIDDIIEEEDDDDNDTIN